MTRLLSLLLIVMTNSAVNAQNKAVQKDYDITYEIFVQSFSDSNGDGIGDINGMTQRLGYLSDLGVDAVWLMPIMASPSYHKYDVTDYKSIHQDYGSMDDFKQFVKAAHERDIKIVIDLIINHTSSEHPWFKSAMSDENSLYRDYYVWADKDSIADQLAKKEVSFDSDNITQWHAVNSDTLAEHYYGFFYGGMPDLNFDNPKVRQEIYDIGKFWLEEVGVDGFRLDAAKHIYPDDRAEDNHTFWAEFKVEMEKVNPNVYLVGEVWASTDVQAPYAQGFSALFNFDLAFSILETLNKGVNVSAAIAGHGWNANKGGNITDKYLDGLDKFRKYNPDFTIATFLSNHDQNRVMSVLGNDIDKAKAAASILFTLPGTPYIYYGEEIGMTGMKPDEHIREPFHWQENSDNNTSWIEPKFTTYESVPTLETQKKDSSSLFNHYKKMIALRKSTPAIQYGNIEQVDSGNPALLAFKRKYQGKELLVVHNISDKAQSLDNLKTGKNIYFSTSEASEVIEALPAYQSVILE